MEIVRDNDSVITIRHGGKIMQWNTSVFGSTKFGSNMNPFREVNGYLASLSDHAQNRIWDIYQKIHRLFNTFVNNNELDYTLIQLVANLYNEIPLTMVDNWIYYNGSIRYRKDLKERHDKDDNHPERTYLKSDYRDLVTFAVMLRFMIPIWGEWLALQLKVKTNNNTQMKEFHALRLLKETELVTSKSMKRLQDYISAFLDRENIPMNAAILTSISSVERVDFVAGNTIVRRIAVGELNADETTGCLISNIHEHIKWLIHGMDPKFEIYRSRTATLGDKENEPSLLEQPKVVDVIPTGDKRIIAVFLEDILRTVRSKDPSVPEQLVIDCINANKNFTPMHIIQHHTLLSQWTLGSIITQEEIPSMSGKERLNTHIATQVLAIHWGFPIVGLLATAIKKTIDYAMGAIGDTRDQVLRDTVRVLNEVFPYVDPNNPTSRQANPVYVAITEMAKMVRSEIWQVNVPKYITNVVAKDIDENGRLIVPPGIAEMIAQFVLKNAYVTIEQYQREAELEAELQKSYDSN